MTSRFLGYLALSVVVLLVVGVVLLVRHRRRILRAAAETSLDAAAYAVRTKRRIGSAIERRIEQAETAPALVANEPQDTPHQTDETAAQRRQRLFGRT